MWIVSQHGLEQHDRGRRGQTAKYFYDASNNRVRIEAFSTLYEELYNLTGQKVAITNAGSGSIVEEDTHLGTRPLAAFFNGSLSFEHQDWLGTERFLTGSDGKALGNYTSYPFGDGYVDNGVDLDPYHYAGMEHDYESTLDHATFREYQNAGGRWVSPDPYQGSYDFTNPQSLNRYAYALNDPLSLSDPTGLDTCPPGSDSGNNACINDPGSGPGFDPSQECIPGVNCLSFLNPVAAGPGVNPGGRNTGPQPHGPGVGRPGVSSRLACAAKFGQSHSIGAAFGGGAFANFLGGNAVSGVLNAITSGKGLNPFAQGPFNTGIGLGFGLPINDALRLAGKPTNPLFGSAAGAIRSAVVSAAVNSFIGANSSIVALFEETSVASFAGIATTATTAAEAASFVGLAKFGFDASTVLYGALVACEQ